MCAEEVKAKGELLDMTENDVKGLGGLSFHGIAWMMSL